MSNGETMRLLQFFGYQKPFEFREVPIPEARPGALIRKSRAAWLASQQAK